MKKIWVGMLLIFLSLVGQMSQKGYELRLHQK